MVKHRIVFVCNNIVDEKNRTRYNRAFFLCKTYKVHLIANGFVCKEIANRTISLNQLPTGVPGVFFPFWAFIKILQLRVGKNIIIYTTYEPLNLLVGFLAKKTGIKWIADIWDDPEKMLMILQSLDYGIKNCVLRFIRRMEHSIPKIVLKHTDLCVTLIKPELMAKYGVNPNRIYSLTNGVNLDINYPVPSHSTREMFSLIYVGPMERTRLMELPSLLKELSKKIGPFRIYLIGPDIKGGSSWFKIQIKDLYSKIDVKIEGRLPHHVVLNYLADSDVSLCLYPNLADLNGAYPIKIFESMVMAKPVVATRLRGISEIINNGVNGYLVDPGNIKEAVEIIVNMKNDEDLKREIGKQAQKRAHEFNWEIIHEGLKEKLNDFINEPSIN